MHSFYLLSYSIILLEIIINICFLQAFLNRLALYLFNLIIIKEKIINSNQILLLLVNVILPLIFLSQDLY